MENSEASVSTLQSASRTVQSDNPKVCGIILTFNRLTSFQKSHLTPLLEGSSENIGITRIRRLASLYQSEVAVVVKRQAPY